MYVTYKLFKERKQVVSYNNAACFSDVFEYDWSRLRLFIYTSNLNKDNKDFWLDLCKQIEPSIKILKNSYISIPFLERGKTLTILTILRYLWEDSNYYDIIVPLTKKIIDKYPDIDPLVAITMAASSTTRSDGWAHSIVNAMADTLVTVKDYKRYRGDTVQKLFNQNSGYPLKNELDELRNQMVDSLDIEPVLKYYNYE